MSIILGILIWYLQHLSYFINKHSKGAGPHQILNDSEWLDVYRSQIGVDKIAEQHQVHHI